MHNVPDFLKISSEMQQHFKKGGMIKRADGSYSRRGLWDNIRANKGSGKKPTKEMLEQEAKIKAKEQYGGIVEEFGKGGYTVKRSHDRKGKTHVVIGPDGTKKYFGDSKLGQHPNDPARKKAFYARHKHNLAHNPYFRAFARATWEDGGEVPEFAPGGYYSGFFSQEEANRIKRSRTPNPDSMSPSFFAMGGLNQYKDGDPVIIDPYRTPTRTFTPPASNYPTYQMDMRGTENRWADRQPLEGMQVPPVIYDNKKVEPIPNATPNDNKVVPIPTTPVTSTNIPFQQSTTVAEDRSNLSQEIKQNAAEFKKPKLSKKERKQQELEERIKNRASVEKMEEVPMSIRNSEQPLNNQIPTSLIKAAPVTKSYLENTYDSTEGIPKTVLQFFDTKGFNPAYTEDTEAVRGKVIFDQTTNKAYTREYNPETGKFKIISAPIASDEYTKKALLRDVGAYSDEYGHSFAAYAAVKGQDGSMCVHGECMPDDSGEIHFYEAHRPEGNTNYIFANVDETQSPNKNKWGEMNDFITVNSGKSFDENIELMKQTNKDVYNYQKVGSRINLEDFENATEKLQSQLKRSLTEEEKSQLKAAMLQRQKNVPYNENVVRLPSHNWVQYYLPEFQDEYDPKYEERKRNEYRKYVNYTPSESYNEETEEENKEEQKKFGGRIYKRGGSIRRFDVGGDNPFENQMSSQNEFESTYNPYSVNPWATGQPQQSVAAASSGNPFQNQLNSQNQAMVTGSPYGTTIPQTGNTGQGVNTTTPQQSPAVAATTPVQSSTPVQPAATPATTIDNSAKSAAEATLNQISGNIGKPSVPTSLPFPANSGSQQTTQPAAPGMPSNQISNAQAMKGREGKENKIYRNKRGYITDEYGSVLGENNKYYDAFDQRKAGWDKVGLGVGTLAQTLSSGLSTSRAEEEKRYGRQEASKTANFMPLASNYQGKEYAKYGGKIMPKEGEVIDLSTQQMHQLEKQGYKFQIL